MVAHEYTGGARYNSPMTLRLKASTHMPAAHIQRARVRGAVRYPTLYILAAALAGGLGLWAAERQFAPPPANPPPSLRAVTLFPGTRALASFRLLGGSGGTFTPTSLKGHWTLVYLGYTHCPDVCPTTLQMLGLAEKSWATLAAAKRPHILFVSVDPKRDSPDATPSINDSGRCCSTTCRRGCRS